MREVPGEFVEDEVLIERIDATLREVIEDRGLPEPLRGAVLYAALGPGKRVRPLLVLRSAAAVGDPTQMREGFFEGGENSRGLREIFRGGGGGGGVGACVFVGA